jgi:hypothetical protein
VVQTYFREGVTFAWQGFSSYCKIDVCNKTQINSKQADGKMIVKQSTPLSLPLSTRIPLPISTRVPLSLSLVFKGEQRAINDSRNLTPFLPPELV